jgi:sec-independent protein translocase protein TatA
VTSVRPGVDCADRAGRASLTFTMGIENPVHLLFIAIVALIVLGPRRLPGLARAVGKGVREFREAIGQGESDRAERAEIPQAVDPAQPVRSPDAPDRSPL